ncbi:MAG: malonyl-CoA decarboxylase [Rhodospirillaceae bacterium]|jgi:malonyl-CoA decarboxylase|nr:malonyl-CoA decarboxylase [Rhodospirillaceae bacterium]MBT5244769.1 malonyl-CoA decarboxylase [Rhodospirillaceae bacterium]MBT5562510.1 malonyl-CoA decarboxylase [Rhodospirillaceae bacterium]MBT6242148.1 malonyl-CoA decarboxylase [Rhodospirillaceae bacterium]MBT7138527.1 malonyl-CoA decarboxylase [Rhodospirillaceae bacterium]
MSEESKSGFLERTLKNLRHAWQGIAGSEYDESAASLQPDLPETDAARLLEQMHACLETRGGEVSARARAAALGRAYLALNKTGKVRFLTVLAENFDVDHGAVDAAVLSLQQASDQAARLQAEADLRKVLEPPRLKLLTQFNALPEGVKFLVDMRADLLAANGGDSLLNGLEQDLKGLLITWFDVDFLELRRISWDSSSASLLEKLIAYEAVHAIESWDDLKNRLDSDRRCFAYFHPRMPDEPLIFVEVALVDGMSDSIQALLDGSAPVIDPTSADTAIFYSISNAQKGLAGISFGNFLIKGVVNSLSSEFKRLKTFATLSPVPGFKAWLDKRLAAGDNDAELKVLLDDSGWPDDKQASDALQGPLKRLAAQYLAAEKMRKGGLRALDPVAHFHLSNGARIERLNWLGDVSAKGLGQSAGLMVNYLYKLSHVEANHEAYTSSGKVAASSSVRSLL